MAKKASQKRTAAEPVEAAKPLKKAKDTQEDAATADVKYVVRCCPTAVKTCVTQTLIFSHLLTSTYMRSCEMELSRFVKPLSTLVIY